VTEIIALRSILYAADEPANHYIDYADGRAALVSCREFYEAMEAIRADAGRELRRVDDDTLQVAAVACPLPATLDEALAEMAAKGKAARPALAGRLDSAAQLVRDGLVLLEGDTARIGPYTITAETCACRDFEYRGGWCKHRLAVRMARHLTAHGFALPAPQPAAPAPQISARNRALIAGGTVIDRAQRERDAFRRSGYGAEQRAINAAANGRTIPAADWLRLHGGNDGRE